ncbi:MAG: aspartate aminotransferase family protein [Saprospiraceae bacterium]
MKQQRKNPISLSKKEMQKVGYKVIDTIVEHLTEMEDLKIHAQQSPAYLNEKLGGNIPTKGQNPLALIEQAKQEVFGNVLHVDHPRFYAFIPSPGNFMGVMADTLAKGFNVFNGHWLAGSGSAAVERITIDWLKDICGFPKTGGGLFLSGGSMANLSAIATARKIKLQDEGRRGVVYYSQQTHSSLAKGLKVLGIGEKYRRPIPIDKDLKIDLRALKKAIKKDIKNGLTPFCIVANAGTTNAGVVDPLNKMAKMAKKYNCWLHVDGAYGAAAMLTRTGKRALKGIEKADSLTLDPHKWWFQPMEIGCLLVKNANHLKTTFQVSAEYLEDTKAKGLEEINYYDHGIQLTRSFRALKLYLSLKTFGLKAFKKAIQKGIDMAEYTEKLLGREKDWKIITPAQLGIINFVYAPTGASLAAIDASSKAIAEKIMQDGFAMITTTKINDLTVLRMCPIHPGLMKADIRQTIGKLKEFAQ